MDAPRQSFACTVRSTRQDHDEATAVAVAVPAAHSDSLIHLMTHLTPLTLPRRGDIGRSTTLPPLQMPAVPGAAASRRGGAFLREDLLKVLQEAQDIMNEDDET
eukprot:scaffold46565_cov321-Amphora_coffeaeformis.AAC.1